MSNLRTEYVPVSQLKANPINPRIIKDAKFKKLCDSIKEDPEYFEARPCLVNKAGVIFAGTQRWRAAQSLGIKKVPVIVMDNPAMETKRMLRDNMSSGEWDFDILANEFPEDMLKNVGFDLKTFPEIEIPRMENEDDIPEVKATKIKRGDIFELGQHRLLCGDATEAENVARLMGGEKADMVFTDPPYNVAYGESKNPRHKIRKIENDKLGVAQWEDFCKKLFSNFKTFASGDIYIWGASSPEGMKMRLWVTEMGAHWSATIIWKKQQLVLSPANYQRIYEPCFYGWFGKSSFVGDRKQVEVWEIDRPHNSKLHPTMKPVELCEKGILNSSTKGQTVLDLFGGSGSTLIACEKTKRKCRMIEIDPSYCQVIIDRWEAFTGLKANPCLTNSHL